MPDPGVNLHDKQCDVYPGVESRESRQPALNMIGLRFLHILTISDQLAERGHEFLTITRRESMQALQDSCDWKENVWLFFGLIKRNIVPSRGETREDK